MKCADGTCRIESSDKTTKIILWVITAIVLGAISFLWWYPVLVDKLSAKNTAAIIVSKIETKEKKESSNCPVTETKKNSGKGNYEIISACCK